MEKKKSLQEVIKMADQLCTSCTYSYYPIKVDDIYCKFTGRACIFTIENCPKHPGEKVIL